jgi:hypothetical protein
VAQFECHICIMQSTGGKALTVDSVEIFTFKMYTYLDAVNIYVYELSFCRLYNETMASKSGLSVFLATVTTSEVADT